MSKADPLLIAQVEARMEELGHVVFSGIESINLVGLRSPNLQAGDFDDQLLAFWSNDDGYRSGYVWRATTDPGGSSLERPANAKGCAILLPGQTRGSHVVGKHRGRYPALVQQKPMRFVRDNDGDRALDIAELVEAGKVYEEVIGLNIHAASRDPFNPAWDRKRMDGVDAVGMWSSACQVLADSPEYRDEHWKAILMTTARYGPSITYTLLDWPD